MNFDEFNHFGKEMRLRREELGKSMKDLAELLGTSVTYVSDLEFGEKLPRNTDEMLKIISFLEWPAIKKSEWPALKKFLESQKNPAKKCAKSQKETENDASEQVNRALSDKKQPAKTKKQKSKK